MKNAYDADANEVVVQLDLASNGEASITVTDDGEGMSLDLLQSVWLVPGDDHRRRQREEGRRSAKHHRLPARGEGAWSVRRSQTGQPHPSDYARCRHRRVRRGNRLE